MQAIGINITSQTRKDLENQLRRAEYMGDLRKAKRIMAILAVGDGTPYGEIASILHVCVESIRQWVKKFVLDGPKGLKSKKIPGCPPKLTKSQKKELEGIIEEGPSKAGFPGACWRSPMVQHLIRERFGVFYAVNYISQLLKNMGFSYQKAKFEAEKKDDELRKKWWEKKWPEILKLAKKKDGRILFGDEASFPQWGSLSYTWAKKGKQPVVKTSGSRRGYKVFGLIDYSSGAFYHKGHEGRFNSESYANFLTEVMSKTKKFIILIHDNARYHTSKAMEAFFSRHEDRLKVYRLPTYSPDYNPIERLWKKIKEKEIHLHYFPTFESLKDKVQEALLRFQNIKEEVLSLFACYRKVTDAFLKSDVV